MHAGVFIALAALATLATAAASAQDDAAGLPLVRDGKSDYVIVLSQEASPSEKRGAHELQHFLREISGARLRITTDEHPLPAHAILVGRSRHTDALGVTPDAARLGPDGFVLKTSGPHLVILGSRVRGTMYGCSAVLEALGVRWYTPSVTRLPHERDITLPALDETQVPAFEYREPYFYEAYFDKDWAARNRLNGFFEHLDASTGGKLIYHPFVHSFDELIPRSLYATHPEYFPLIKGERKNGYVQRCLSNPDVLKLAIARVKEWMRDHPEATIYSVSQNDTYNFCECDNCRAIEQRYGGQHSGLYLWFVNQVADAVKQEHPDKLIDTLAYQFTEPAPTGIVPRENVRIRLCPIGCCEAHPLEQCSFPANGAALKALREWGAITNTLYVWHYNTDFANYLMPFPDFDEFPADARLYYRTGVKGIFFQGAYAKGGGGSDAELRSYVMSKLLWDVNVDTDALVTEWMQGVYGPAWKPLRAWFDLLHEKARDPNKHFGIYVGTDVHYLSPDVVAEGNRLFDEAERLAAGDKTAADYVAKSRLWLRYVEIMQHPSDGPEFQRFMADVRHRGITELREGQTLGAWEANYLKRARGEK